jgi:hypothetical protein
MGEVPEIAKSLSLYNIQQRGVGDAPDDSDGVDGSLCKARHSGAAQKGGDDACISHILVI